MYYRLEDIFAIGIGPSSSHTVGPMKAAKRYTDTLIRYNLLPQIERLQVDLYGSLALTGVGHGTLRAIIYGLMGFEAEDVDTEKPYCSAVEKDKILHLAQQKAICFDMCRDMVLNKETFLPEHSNGMTFSAFDAKGALLLKETYFSIGGGTIVRQDEFGRQHAQVVHPVPYQFDSCAELQQICRDNHLTFSDVVLQNEFALNGEEKTLAYLKKIRTMMDDAVERGMRHRGILPGGLEVKRRAPEIYDRLREKFIDNQQDGLEVIDWLNLWGFAVAEENAAGGRVVTAPTMGSAGILPSVLRYFERFASHTLSADAAQGSLIFLTTAAAICSLYRTNASISGAEVGCQGEVGVACSMAAAGLTAAMRGSNDQIEQAAEIAIEHNLGLTCDPVNGLVQIPCIERNAMGAVKAVNAARLALRGDGKHIVSLDEAVKTMYDTGKDMSNRYKETSLGGLAVNIANC